MVRGPGIKPNTTVKHPIAAVDLAPTITDMMNSRLYRQKAGSYDGDSFVPLIDPKRISDKVWRENILVEYHGEGHVSNKNCPNLGPGVSVNMFSLTFPYFHS